MPHYHCVAIGCQNGSRKSDKLEKFPETVLPNGGPFASPALESTRLFVTGNSGSGFEKCEYCAVSWCRQWCEVCKMNVPHRILTPDEPNKSMGKTLERDASGEGYLFPTASFADVHGCLEPFDVARCTV
nr:hypothetical protein BaRGS_014086 [Batillaria attramentaria]